MGYPLELIKTNFKKSKFYNTNIGIECTLKLMHGFVDLDFKTTFDVSVTDYYCSLLLRECKALGTFSCHALNVC